MLYPTLKAKCHLLTKSFSNISQNRQEMLHEIGGFITEALRKDETPRVNVICTHNSRRSHIGQLWLAVAAEYYELPHIQSFSGGTEATAFNPNAVDAMRRAGLEILLSEGPEKDDNPIYYVKWKPDMKSQETFSKRYNDKPNPTDSFLAIMVCSQADEDCPVVLGASARASLPFDDPKASDGSGEEKKYYDLAVDDIGRHMLYVMNHVKESL